jgi:hypothetical protein
MADLLSFQPFHMPVLLSFLNILAVVHHITEENGNIPHSAFQGQTPDEMYCNTGVGVPDELAFYL